MKKIATALLLIALSFGAFIQIQAQQVAVDRSLDLAWSQLPGYGFISLPSMRFGKGTASTFQITVYYRGGGNGCIMRFGTSQSGNVANYVGITINTGFLAIQVGDKTVQSTATVPTNAWKDISVVVENKLNGANLQGYVTAYIADVEIALNGRWVNPIPDATREQSFVGHCENGQRFNGLVDNLRIWGKALTATEIKQNSAAGFDDLIKTGLVAHFPMNEGKGIYTGGVSGSDADDFFSALLSGNFAWGAKAQTGVTQCGSSGDPHLSPWIGNYYDPPHVPGYFLMVQCIDQGESQFEIRTYHSQGCCWGKATVTEAVTIKHFNTIFLVARGAVYQKRTIPVETFVTVNPVDQTLESGMKVFFGKSGSYPWVNVYGPPYGFIKITDYINYFVMTTGVTEDCKGRSGLCSSQVYFLNSWQFKFDDVTIPEVAITNPPPPNQNPCDNAIPEVAAAAKAACDALFGADDTYLDEKINCLFDVCSSGDLTSVGDRSSHEACLIAEQRAAAAGEVYIPTVDCEPKCPGMCSGLGTCDQQTGKCTCNSGWAGPDCRQKASIHYFTVESSYYNKGVLLSRELSGPDFPTQSYTIDNLIMASKFNVPASALFYVAQVTNTITNTVDSHLYIINNANTDRGTAAYNLKATYDSGFVGTPVVHKFEASTAGTQIVADPTNIDFSWSDGVTGGAIIKNLPNQPWCVTFQVTSDSLEQVLLGSGQRVLQTLDISKLPKADWASFKICGEELENPCADIDNCADCAANPQCGWCREKQACFLGNQAGPTDGSMCKNWRFSFDSNISRRIQASFGWPMNPDHSEVFLVENPVGKPFAKLPLDLTVDMGKEDNSVWDVLLVVPNAKSTNELDKVAITAQSATIVSYLTQFPDLALAIGSYSVAPNQFKLEIPLKNADNDHVFFEIALSGIILDAAAPGGANDQRSVLEALKAAATTSNPGFRQFARRMVFIVVDRPYSTATTSIASVKAALLSQNIIPVFAATPAVKQTYQALVAQLGFGSVVDHTAGSQHFVKELNLGFKKAGGAIALVVDDSNVGYVDTANYNTDIMNIQGLTQKMRGKFLFPMIADANEALSEKTSKLIAPGFGFATVHNVLSDLPVATGVNVIAIEDQTLSPFDDTEPGIYVSLTGHAFDNDGEVIPRITVLPVLGKLFQVNDQHLKGPEITQVDTLVTDPLFRVIYEPVQYGNSVGNAPYATLTYVVQDACTDSKPKEVGIVITAINHAPFANAFGQIAFEDTDLTFELKGFDIEGHPLKAIVVKAPFEIDTNGVEVASGQLFQYNNGQRGDEIVFGVETEVTDENRRVIFAPKPDHNSEGRPITRFTKPTMTFKVKESSHFPEDDPNWPMLESTEQSFQIFVTAVNDRPTVNIPGLDEAQLAADGICFSGTCTVLEDLGAPLGQTANPKLIFVGGSDPEGDVLKVVVTAVSCKHEPTLALVGQSAQIAVNTETTGLASGVHEPRFQFRPLQDTFDATSYCTFTYKVNDGELDSLDTRTVVIAVTPVNDQPRPVDGQAGSLAVGEGETQTFTLSGFDPENQPFNLVLFSCNPAVVSYPKGTLVYNGQTINCDDVSPASPLTLSPVVGAPSGVFEFSFTAPVFQSGDSNVLIYAFSDGSIPDNQLVQSMFQLVILDINQPPLFFTPLAPAETFQQKIFDITVEVGQELTFNLHVAQNDGTNGRVDFRAQITQFAATGDLFITWPLNPDNPPFDISVGPTIIADPINMVPPFDIIRTPGDSKAVTNGQNKFSFSAPFAMMNTFLPSLRFKGIAPSPAGQTHRVECIVEDNGNSGSGGNKRAQVTFNIKVVAPGANNSLAGAAAAAGLVAAGIAAVAGWRKLRRRDDNGFQPWTMDAEEDFVTNNPLFEGPRESMNQIYEAPSTVNKQ